MADNEIYGPEEFVSALHELNNALDGKNVSKFTEEHGINAPPLDNLDLSVTASILAEKFSQIEWGMLKALTLVYFF